MTELLISTQRLRLRRLRQDDAAALSGYRCLDLPPGSEPIIKLELGMFDLHPNLDPVGTLGMGLLR